MRKFQLRELREQKYPLWVLCPSRTNPLCMDYMKAFPTSPDHRWYAEITFQIHWRYFLGFLSNLQGRNKRENYCMKLLWIICQVAADKFLIASCHMQIPTLYRTSPALQTVQGMTKLFLLRVGHCSATLNLNKWGKHHKLIPSHRPHPWGHSIHQTNRDWSKALTSKTT